LPAVSAPAPSDERRAAAVVWAVTLTLLWIIAVPALLFSGVMSSFHLYADPPPDDRAGGGYFLAAAVVIVLLPLTVGVLALRARRPVLGWVYLAITVVMLVPAAGLGYTAAQSFGWEPNRPDPPAPPGSGACQEHSGGDTRCPGG
jgi:hypothetical protein